MQIIRRSFALLFSLAALIAAPAFITAPVSASG
jgi:hypothetical protein